MLDNIVKCSPRTPVFCHTPGRGEVTDNSSPESDGSSPLTSNLYLVRNSKQELSGIDKNPVSRAAKYLNQAGECLRAADGGQHTDGNIAEEGGMELTEILSRGETLRSQAEHLRTPCDEQSVPHGWKAGLFKRCLVGVGILAGAGVLGGAGYKYYVGRNSNGEGTDNFTPSGSAGATPYPVIQHEGYGGNLEDVFGHGAPRNSVRRHRRHRHEHVPGNTTTSEQSNGGTKFDERDNSQLHLFTEKANKRIRKVLKEKGLLKTRKVYKEKMLYAVAVYLFYGKDNFSGNKSEIKILAKNILAANELYGGKEDDRLSTAQAESVVRGWIFSNILGKSPVEYMKDKMKADVYPKHYTVDSIHHLLSVSQLPIDGHLHTDRLSSWDAMILTTMWHSFLIEEMPFLKFEDGSLKKLGLGDYDFAHLYTGSHFLQAASIKTYTPEEAMEVGEKMWGLAASDGVTEDKLHYFSVPALFFTASVSKRDSGNDFDAINSYLQHRKEISEVRKDIEHRALLNKL